MMAATRVPIGHLKSLKAPHSTLERISKRILPKGAHLFLFSQPNEYPTARFFLGALFGAVNGAGLFLGLFHNIPMTSVHRLVVGYAFVALCILGGAFSSFFRCSALLMFPSMLGSRGRAYLMLLVLCGLYNGPITNIHRNVQDVSFSMGCNIELQIQHSKVMWKVVMDPFMRVMQNIVEDNKEFLEEAKSVSQRFQNIRDEVRGQYGYDNIKQEPTGMAGNSSQDEYTAKTMMRCDYVVEEGIQRCQEWFSVKWEECMDAVKAPVINQILCVPMKFLFLCDVMRVMTPWCREQIPIEKNFGQTFEMLNVSIDTLAREFTANVVLKKTEQESLFGATVQEDFTENLRQSFEETKVVLDQLRVIIQSLLSFTFLTVFISAFGYARQYSQDVRFDNIYITTYFRQIDARRKRAGKRYLLPLKRAERGDFINPLSLVIHPSELKLVTVGLLQVLSIAVFATVLLAVDMMLYHIFDIIRRHTFTEFSLTSSHHIDINVGGQSMMAKLLRKSIGAFNSSSDLNMQSTNQHCLPQPRALTTEDYLWSTVPLLMMALLCCLQVYSNRLRRVIAAFYFPKREKRRALFLYNLQIQRRISYTDRQRRQLTRRGQSQKYMLPGLLPWLERLGCKLRWCCVCEERVKVSGAVECPVPGCQAVYCAQCWRDMGKFCHACAPITHCQTVGSCSDTDVYYVG